MADNRRRVVFEDGDTEQSTGVSMMSNRVYVGNLSYDTHWTELKDHFRAVANVVFAEVFRTPDGYSKGCGIVEFATKEDAALAISKLNDSELDGRLIFVREDREVDKPRDFRRPEGFGRGAPRFRGGSNKQSKGRKLFIGNLPFSTTSQDLKDAFSQCGNIVDVYVTTDRSGRSKGHGCIEFENASDAQDAIDQFNNTKFQGRPIIVKEDKFE
eukprot:TRINITY_DN3024_c0_g1_i1.p1 TRINITY_DN3024_c0_g1~~TRINITY_DN3024_c0_g1_i1.p1  ORF type:complete len:213 (-),score=32.33 TRINITY_DN3024_c0_g1_i1:135-773(-)